MNSKSELMSIVSFIALFQIQLHFVSCVQPPKCAKNLEDIGMTSYFTNIQYTSKHQTQIDTVLTPTFDTNVPVKLQNDGYVLKMIVIDPGSRNNRNTLCGGPLPADKCYRLALVIYFFKNCDSKANVGITVNNKSTPIQTASFYIDTDKYKCPVDALENKAMVVVTSLMKVDGPDNGDFRNFGNMLPKLAKPKTSVLSNIGDTTMWFLSPQRDYEYYYFLTKYIYNTGPGSEYKYNYAQGIVLHAEISRFISPDQMKKMCYLEGINKRPLSIEYVSKLVQESPNVTYYNGDVVRKYIPECIGY